MPLSKSEWLAFLGEQNADNGPVANVGDLLVYSYSGCAGPFTLCLVHEVEQGFVTAVRLLAGTVRVLGRRPGTIRWVAHGQLALSPDEILKAVPFTTSSSLETLVAEVARALQCR